MLENELSIIQKTYDLIKWFIPLLNKLPRDHKFNLGDRMISELYQVLEGLIIARYSKEKLPILEMLNTKLEILRYQTRLLYDFELINVKRYEYVSTLQNEIGIELGAWVKQQRKRAWIFYYNFMTYQIEFKPWSIKDLAKLAPKDRAKVLTRIEQLQTNLSGDIKKLTNFTPEYRLRVGDYRVLFELQEKTVMIYRIAHRREIYQQR